MTLKFFILAYTRGRQANVVGVFGYLLVFRGGCFITLNQFFNKLFKAAEI